ncbi:PspC domain-containing protein [Lederbergia galactosidilytica]|uniref:PspC domain-containing protein n=1 Tax=Lederbergia galactosidilytica TaxID=217031 RepID=UPI0009EF594D|nr:PspC domain-containing protein [Lederbergia galactosidilytica]MBP1914042.1 phage shock protein PspC (stress-responsive transcriptional regulator) [Lederbergia galactosidilytica]
MNNKKLRRSTTDRSLHGVCGGIAEFFGISSFLVRLLFIFVIPGSLFIYLILANTLADSPRSL